MTATAADRTYSRAALDLHAALIPAEVYELPAGERMVRIVAARTLVQELLDMLTEDAGLTALTLAESKIGHRQTAAACGIAASTVQGWMERARPLVQSDAVPVEAAVNGLARDGAPERIEA